MAAQFEYDVFISHGHLDRVSAQDLQQALLEHGLTVWRDDRLSATPTATALATATQALERSARVIVLWSRHSATAPRVKAEAERARVRNAIIPVALEPLADLLALLPATLAELPILDINSDAFDIDSLLRALDGLPGSRPSTLATAKVDVTRLYGVRSEHVRGREHEIAHVLQAWDGAQTGVFVIHAPAGAGKTALAMRAISALKTCGWRGARRIFGWSFVGQSIDGHPSTSTDDFFTAATHFFSGYTAEPPKTSRDKGPMLAKLIQDRRAILVLDGLETLLVAGASGQPAHIADPAMASLLDRLADANPGLCLITSRFPLAGLEGHAGVVQRALPQVPLMSGIDVLREAGVEPDRTSKLYKMPDAAAFATMVPSWQPPATYETLRGDDRAPLSQGTARQFVHAVEDLKGHALALTLAGTYLTAYHQGDIRALKDLPTVKELSPRDERHASFRVLRAIEAALAKRIDEQGQAEKPASVIAGQELALLLFLGLFDRPADTALVKVVFSKSVALKTDPAELALAAAELDKVPDEAALPEREQARRRSVRHARRRLLFRRLISGMHVLNGDDLRQALGGLAEQGLIAKVDPEQSWDQTAINCHPLVREYFARRWKALDPTTYQAAHGRLYDHHRLSALPEAFKTPVNYALLMDECADPDYGARRTVADLIQGNVTPEAAALIPKVLLETTAGKLGETMDVMSGPDWEAALDAFQPATQAGMLPLFAAVRHGCASTRHDEVWAQVMVPRIARGRERFAATYLGLTGQTLEALSSLATRSSASPHAEALGEFALTLLLVGRRDDAVQPLQTAIGVAQKDRNFSLAAQLSASLAGVLRTAGILSGADGALARATAAVALADQSQDGVAQRSARQVLASMLLTSGHLAEAETVLHAVGDPGDVPFENSIDGHCLINDELRLARGRVSEIAGQLAPAAQRGHDEALSAGLRSLVAARAAGNPKLSASALAALRRTNCDASLASALLAHTQALWQSGDAAGAEAHLKECEALCARADVPLIAADTGLLKARMLLSGKRAARARKYRDEAADLIETLGYGRARPELAVLDAEIAHAERAGDAALKITAAIKAVEGTTSTEASGHTVDGGWWGLWPRLDAILSGGATGDHPARARLHAAHDAFIHGHSALVTDDIEPVDEPVHHDFGEATNYDDAPDHGSAHADSAEPEITDEELDEILADDETCRALQDMLKDADIETPFHELPRDEQRTVVATFVAAMNGAPEAIKTSDVGAATTPSASPGPAMPQPNAVTDAYIHSVFADPSKHALLIEIMREADLDGEPTDLASGSRRELVELLVELGELTPPADISVAGAVWVKAADPVPTPSLVPPVQSNGHAPLDESVVPAVGENAAEAALLADTPAPTLGTTIASAFNWWPFKKRA